MSALTVPATSDIDIFSDEVIFYPYDAYRELRAAAPAVRLTRYPLWFISRYDDVRAALSDPITFSSSAGVGVSDEMNAMQAGTVLASDDPAHAVLRAVLSEKLAPRALAALRADIEERADAIVATAVAQGAFDAVAELAARLPVDVVADLIGLPAQGRELLLPGADAMFATFGPFDERLQSRLGDVTAYVEYMAAVTNRDSLTPGSWGSAILDAVDEGRIAPESAERLMTAYLIASMDTTVHALGSLLHLLASDSELWRALKDDPDLVGSAFEETVRLETPAQAFTRTTTRAVEIGGTTVPDGSRVVVSFGAANRDERHYPQPDRFQLGRNPLDHLGFGYGVHGCAGQGLARLEAKALVGALLRRVELFELAGAPQRHPHPIIRGWAEVPVRVVAAAGC